MLRCTVVGDRSTKESSRRSQDELAYRSVGAITPKPHGRFRQLVCFCFILEYYFFVYLLHDSGRCTHGAALCRKDKVAIMTFDHVMSVMVYAVFPYHARHVFSGHVCTIRSHVDPISDVPMTESPVRTFFGSVAHEHHDIHHQCFFLV